MKVATERETLNNEYDFVTKALDNKKDVNTIKFRRAIYGEISLEEAPFEIQLEMIRSKLGVAPHIWQQYDAETIGKTAAVEILSNRMEIIKAFHREVEHSRQKAMREAEQASNKGNKSRNSSSRKGSRPRYARKSRRR